MPKPIGPTIPRWQLGEQLNRWRLAAKMSLADPAGRLGCSHSKIQKIEQGEVGAKRVELEALLDLYGITDEAMRAQALELQRLGSQRGWWSKYGAIPAPFSNFLGLESAATRIRIFEPLMIHGLFQIESYAQALSEAVGPGLAEAEVDRQVQIRMERQQRTLTDMPAEIWLMLDEAALRRPIGGRAVMAHQIRHLIKQPRSITIQVVPFANGGYPGVAGAVTIFDLPEELHTAVGYVESQAGNLYLEKSEDLGRTEAVYRHISAAALSKQQSRILMQGIAREFETPD
jgi:transcriptional regulator with XRE-family HTH domain